MAIHADCIVKKNRNVKIYLCRHKQTFLVKTYKIIWRKHGMAKKNFFKNLARNVEHVAYMANSMKCMGYFYEPQKPEILKNGDKVKL